MAWLRRLFGADRPDRPELDLSRLVDALDLAAAAVERQGVSPEVLRARIADAYRDEDVVPPSPESFDEATAGLDVEALHRLAILAAALDLVEIRGLLVRLLPAEGAAQQLEDAFVRPAIEKPLLTLAVIRQSRVRVEELARELAAGLGVGIEGESPAESESRRELLDYARLMEQAEKNRAAAAEHAAYVRGLVPDEPPRRSKW
ncbi:MAG: hypothetical protein HYV07_00065 [Deltaproteobacteria bacterium]|nr:hypothetical protein [Deltaproteobacteria bacterium]